MIYTINMHALKNRLGITNKRELEEAENAAMATAFNELLGMYEAPHKFTSADIRMVHKAWLGGIYEWAGEYRQVDVRKGDISFAPAKQIPPLMDALERGSLQQHTPCNFRSANRVTQALAEEKRILFGDSSGTVRRLQSHGRAVCADHTYVSESEIPSEMLAFRCWE